MGQSTWDTHTHTHMESNQTNMQRKLARKQRAVAKAASKEQRKEMKLANKGRPSRQHRGSLQEQAQANVQQVQQQQGAISHKRSAKLARQLNSLMQRDAQSQTLVAKADQLLKAQWREARVADFGTKGGLESTARCNRRSALLVAAC